jgi:polyisoprenoid-binding protein YceI
MRSFKLLFALILFVPGFSFAQVVSLEGDKSVSYIQYVIRHPLHTVKAINKEPKFIIDFDVKQKKILRAEAVAEVMKFNSGNSNRDSHAMEVVEALKYPLVSFKSSEISLGSEDIVVKGFLTFHGKTKEIEMRGKAKFEGNALVVEGGFNVSLTEFGVKRPSLFFIKSEDTLKMYLFAKFNLPE